MYCYCLSQLSQQELTMARGSVQCPFVHHQGNDLVQHGFGSTSASARKLLWLWLRLRLRLKSC
jgi:hypothetical protein